MNSNSGDGADLHLNPDFIREIDREIPRWFREDIGEGDHTSRGIISAEVSGSARLLVKEKGILAGMKVAERIFNRFDPTLELKKDKEDGQPMDPGQVVFTVWGSARSILQCERLVLNIMQRMSGIATTTRSYVQLIEGTGAKILDTRKTTPGFRILEKEAVRLGGGINHRFGLYDMILIKDNHIDFAGGIEEAIGRNRDYMKRNGLRLDVIVEARNLEDVKIILEQEGVRRILLDNFSVEETRQAVELINRRMETESSGGITQNNIRDYALCGVDYVSVGALTHQIRSLDLSLKADF